MKANFVSSNMKKKENEKLWSTEINSPVVVECIAKGNKAPVPLPLVAVA